MHLVEDGKRGLKLVFLLNWDRFFFSFLILAALMCGAYVASM